MKNDSGLEEFEIKNRCEWRLFTKNGEFWQTAREVEFVAFVDSDDIVLPQAYEAAVEGMKSGADCVFFGAKCFGEGNAASWADDDKVLRVRREGLGKMSHQIAFDAPNCPWTKLFRLGLLAKHRLFFPPAKIGEDEVFKFCYLALCQSVYFISQTLYLYRKNEGSAMFGYIAALESGECRLDCVENFKYIAEFYRQHGLFEANYGFLQRIYTNLLATAVSQNAKWHLKRVLNVALEELQRNFAGETGLLDCNKRIAKFKFGFDIFGLSKELIFVEAAGRRILTKRRQYFGHLFKKKFKLKVVIYTSEAKISYFKLGRKKLFVRRQSL